MELNGMEQIRIEQNENKIVQYSIERNGRQQNGIWLNRIQHFRTEGAATGTKDPELN